jgi:phosphomannomutase
MTAVDAPGPDPSELDRARQTAERWLASEPDDDMRTELAELLAGDPRTLVDRFTGRLQFGTAGLRAAVGAGPQRMNRLVVRQAAAGLVAHLLATDPDARARGVVIGYDARRKSDLFALDTARVCAAQGVRAVITRNVVPTPVLAFNITRADGVGVGAAAGVMVTASHNPPADNGYKVYLGTGAQIVPPADTDIAAQIDLVDPCAVALSAEDDPLIEWAGDEFVERYVQRTRSARFVTGVAPVSVAYTAMHGVGGDTLLRSFAAAGMETPRVVAEQQQPDGSFPTVSFPNPEEPGAMDLVMQLAAECGAAVAIANDPDADRLGAAIPQPDGTWRRLGGDEIGWLLADHVLRHTSGDDRLVVTTLVSSSLLGKMAAHHGVHFAETYTGFKWIGHTALQHPDLRLVFGYEQALGYLVGARPLDKDGITAAIALAEVAAVAAADGVTLQQRLDGITAQFGRHVMAERSVRMLPADGIAAVARLRAAPPSSLGDEPVTATQWFDEAGLLRLQLGASMRVQVRPSGTEPKVKLYGEGIDRDPAPFIEALAALLD